MLSVERDPKNRVYQELIDLCFEVCDEFHLVIRTDMGAIKDLEEIINMFKASLKEMRSESTWVVQLLVIIKLQMFIIFMLMGMQNQ